MSMDSAAMAMMATSDTATSAMVKPRSCRRGSALLRERRISGGSMCGSSVLVKRCSCSAKAGRTDKPPAHQTRKLAVLPIVRVLNGDARADHIYRSSVYCLLCDAAPIDGEEERGGGTAGRSCCDCLPGKSTARLHGLVKVHSAVGDLFRDQIVVYDIVGIGHRGWGDTRGRCTYIVSGIGRSHTGALSCGIGQLLPERDRSRSE